MKLLLPLLLLNYINTFAQDSLIQHIDSTRQEYNSKIERSKEEDMDFFPPRISLKSTLMERAIGEVVTSTLIYFDKLEGDGRENTRPIDYALIRKVEVSMKSGSYLIRNVFYFDQNGALAYYNYNEEGYECYSRSYYFNQSTCIQITQLLEGGPECNIDSKRKNYSVKTLNKSDTQSVLDIYKRTEKYKGLLQTYYSVLR